MRRPWTHRPLDAPPLDAPPLDALPLDALPADGPAGDPRPRRDQIWPAPGDDEIWTAPHSWPAPADDGWRPGAAADWPDDTAAGTGWPQAAPDETAPRTGWPQAAPGSHRPGAVPEYPWPDDAAAHGSGAPGGAASWPSATGSSAHGQNGTGSSAHGQNGIRSARPNEASTAGNNRPAVPAYAGPPSAPGDAWRESAASGGDQGAGDRLADPELAGDERLAMLCYLSVPFLGFLLPLVMYVLNGRRSAFVRGHATQALNLSITALLYTFCVLIVGTILALDTISIALLIAVPLVAALWLATLGYVVRAGAAASRGGYLRIPAWICATIAR